MRAISKYYGTIFTDKGTSTRTGSRFVRASVQSWEGSVSVEITDAGTAIISVTEDSGLGGRELLAVPLEKLVHAGGLAIKKEK